jgi:N-acetylmuramoyl-L-alanine amidase
MAGRHARGKPGPMNRHGTRISARAIGIAIGAGVGLWLGLAEAAPAKGPDAGEAPAAIAVSAPPVAMDLQVSGDMSATRLSFTLSASVASSVTVLVKPDRLVLDLPEVNFQLPADAARRAKGLAKSVRYGLIGPGRSRIVIELAQPALPGRVGTSPILNGAATSLDIELRKADRDSFAKAAQAERREASVPVPVAAAQPAPAARAAADKRPLVVLDPGHGGIDVGALGLHDTIEKDVVLAFARALKAKLEEQGLVRVLMTRSDDTFVSLGDRVKVAQAEQASLFISIHADTVKANSEVRGLTIYTNSERASDAEAARLAESENRSDQVAGLDASDDGEEVNGILGDLMRRETRTYSHLFARTLVGQITAASKLNKNPQRSARFMVLRAPDVPSVLVELGYLSSKSDVELLNAQAWREKAADSVAAAVADFIAPRLAQRASAAAQVP